MPQQAKRGRLRAPSLLSNGDTALATAPRVRTPTAAEALHDLNVSIELDDKGSSSLAAAALERSSPRAVRIRRAAPSSSGTEVGRFPSKE